ncbi:MAG: cytochrome c biogenesis protein [Candidatus Omnitrophota bacterium]
MPNINIYLNSAFVGYFLAMFFYFIGLLFPTKVFPLLARFFSLAGVLLLSLYIGMRWQAAGRPPLSNMFESLIIFAWGITAVFIFIDLRYKIKSIAVLSSLLGLLALGYASLLDKEIAPLLPALKSNWLTIHVFTCFIGYAALTIGFAASLILLFKKGNIENLDSISYKMIALGFLFLALGIISGAVWANSAWGTYWSWDPKETWSLITWFVYAIYLHVRFRKGWRGKRAAWLSVLGFLAMLFTYFGVNYLLSGLHSYA